MQVGIVTSSQCVLSTSERKQIIKNIIVQVIRCSNKLLFENYLGFISSQL